MNEKNYVDGEFNKTGKVNFEGLNLDLSVILGKNIADEYFKNISRQQLDVLFNYMTSEIWEKHKNYETGDVDIPEYTYKIRYRKENDYYNSKPEVPKIAQEAKKELDNKLREEIFKKVEEIISTQDFKHKVEKIAQEIVDYATEGYKIELKERIYQKLVADTTDGRGIYCGINLKSIIQEEINRNIRY